MSALGGNFPGSTADLVGSARWHVHHVLPTGRAEVVSMTPQAYAASDFLDHRIVVPPQAQVATLDFARVPELFPDVSGTTTSYIFHISHVGSTLFAKALARRSTVLGLREPQLLRWLAEIRRDLHEPESRYDPAGFEALLRATLGLLGRRFNAGDEVLVKATSYASNLADDILAAQPRAKAIALYSRFEAFAANILRGQGGWQDMLNQAPSRLRRLHTCLGDAPWRLSRLRHGELVAMNWLCEMVELVAASRKNPGRLCWVEFDDMISSGPRAIGEVARFLGMGWGDADHQQLVADGILSRYSKDERQPFDQTVRQEQLSAAKARHADEIARGLAWLHQTFLSHPQFDCVAPFVERMLHTRLS